MRLIRSKLATLVATLAVLAAPPLATAQPIPIVNPGFEADVLGDGAFIFSATGWTVTGDAGTFNPTTASYPGEAPEGANVAFTGGRGGTLSQTLAAVVQPNTTYTLSVLIGDRLDTPFGSSYVRLLSGGTEWITFFGGMPATDGTFKLLSFGLSTGPADPRIGQALGIELGGLATEFGAQVNFDDVKLTATSSIVPEPATIALVASGLVTLAGVARRRARG